MVSVLTPSFKKPCTSETYSKFIREDSEVEIEVDRETFGPLNEKLLKVRSPVFPSDCTAHFKWRIDFYPRGLNDRGEYSSIILWQIWKKVKTETPVVLGFEAKTPNNKVIGCKEQEYTNYKCVKWVCKKFLNVKKVKTNLTIRAQISAYYEANNSLSNFLSELNRFENYSNFLETGEFSDAELCVGGNKPQKYKVHRVILALRSQVFAVMFDSDMTEKHTNRIEINDHSNSAIENMLKFIYGCGVDFTDLEMTLELIEASEKYNLTDLKLQCALYLTTVLNENNTASILCYAEQYGLLDLKSTTLQYIYDNRDKFSNMEQYQMILKKNPNLLLEVLAKLSVHTITMFGHESDNDDEVSNDDL